MKSLDRSAFEKDIDLLVAKFPNPRFVGEFTKICKHEILNVSNVKHIVKVGEMKGVLLRDDIDDINHYEEHLPAKAIELIKGHGIEISPYKMKLTYNFWKADDILQAILPEHLLHESPSGFAQAGHVAHVNLRNEFKEFGPLIGQVIMDKNPTVKTVVDKLDTINNKFRVFDMNLLAGDDNYLVEQHESGCKFRFDFSTAFWNSRLNTEHERLITQFQPGDVVADVFAGVGPFAVPAAKKSVFVLGNDLNPESYKYLTENATINNSLQYLKTFNLDGRDFIRLSPQLLLDWKHKEGHVEKRRTVKKRRTGSDDSKLISKKDEVSTTQIPTFISHYVMNLPGSAIDFLDEFIGLYTSDPKIENAVINDDAFKLPTIHVHCFEKFAHDSPEPTMEELHRRVHARITKQIQFSAPISDFKFHLVRRVAPTKPMFCVSFTLPKEVAFKKT